jgi:putative two-component system response regulator
LTAQTDEATRRKALEAGAKDFLNKPILPWELTNRVRNLLEVRLLYSRLRDHRDHLDDMVRARTRDLEDTRLDVLRRLALAGEFRDNETGLHVLRMSRYSEILVRALGWDAEASAMMRAAAPLHDIGKISVPDAILLKPGKLDPDEFAVMKKHAEIGARILAEGNFPLLALAHDIALTHHEKWDGSGYPTGKAGADIPLAGRIVAIADVFDALSSPRPYKTAWTPDKAFAFVEEQAGRHFDPDLAARFLAHRQEILAVQAAFGDRIP